MARRFSRSEWNKFLETISSGGRCKDPNETLDIYYEYPEDGFNSYEERSFFQLKNIWEAYLGSIGGLPGQTEIISEKYGYLYDEVYNKRLPKHEVVRAARNICEHIVKRKVKGIEYIREKLRKDVDIVADYFLICDYGAISVALAIFHVNIKDCMDLGSINHNLFFSSIDPMLYYDGELDDDIDCIHLEDNYFWEQIEKKTLNDLIDREILLFDKNFLYDCTVSDEYPDYNEYPHLGAYPHFNEYIITRLKKNKPFGVRMGRPSMSQSDFFDQVVECLKGLNDFRGSYGLFRQRLARLYRSNTHLPLIKFMHDNDFSLFEFSFLMISMFYPVKNVDRYVRFLGRRIFKYDCRWDNYLEKFYSDENPMAKAGWLYFSYPKRFKEVRCHLNLGKIVEQGLILPIKDRPGNRYQVSYVYDYN